MARAALKGSANSETRQRILAEAQSLFRERGFDGTSMAELARRVGITAAGLYWHFDSKAAILGDTLEIEIVDLIHRTGGGATPSSSPRDRLRAFVRGHVAFQLERLDVARLFGAGGYGFPQLVSSLAPEQRDRLQGLERRHMENLHTILRDGVAAGAFSIRDQHATAFAIIAMGEHVVNWWRDDGPLSAAEVADLYADLALRMTQA